MIVECGTVAATAALREAGDLRPSVEELYGELPNFEATLDEALAVLVRDGWLLERDRARERAAALRRWRWIMDRKRGGTQ